MFLLASCRETACFKGHGFSCDVLNLPDETQNTLLHWITKFSILVHKTDITLYITQYKYNTNIFYGQYYPGWRHVIVIKWDLNSVHILHIATVMTTTLTYTKDCSVLLMHSK
ncbi:vacuolar fusion protein MON1-like protein B [Platysternon megacephalum]|uniref:Vacuolar fusion protein MON1-like protein B n=1 Tax=Platysternon megacephalum TaxID=55544 RepID=A0A4D9DEF6_9SAUR|nr:vacuolar fusion protein MON1-like protein B [Platysternon megacephalum]